MRICLPRAEEAAAPATRREPQPSPGTETVLLVEDEDAVRRVAARVLTAHGYEVLEAASGEEAVQLIEQDIRVDLLLTDVVMPGMDGRRVAEAIRARQPDIKVLFASGYSEDVMLQKELVESEARILHKPFTVETLTAGVREALEDDDGRPERETRNGVSDQGR